MRKFNIKVNGQQYMVEVDEVTDGSAPVAISAPAPQPVAVAAAPQPIAIGSGAKLTSPMPGLVLELKVASGASVKKGQAVMVLEAMKMENDIVANADGVITFAVNKGANVNSGDVLATIA